MAFLLADENVPARLVDCLRLLGHSLATVRQISQSKSGDGISDETVLEYAIQRRWAVLSFNGKHFRKLHKERPWHFGIIIGEAEADTKSQAKRIDSEIKAVGSLAGHMIVVKPPPKRRVRRGR